MVRWNKLKILYVNTFYNEAAGAQKSTKLLAESMANLGNEVHVFTIDSSKNNHSEIINDVTVHRTKTFLYNPYYFIRKKRSKFIMFLYKISELFNFESLFLFNRILDEVKPDIVHFNSTTGISIFTFISAKNRKIRSILTLRDYWLIYPLGEKKNKLIDIINSVLVKITSSCLKNINYVTSPSKFTLDKFFEKKVLDSKNLNFEVIPNAVKMDEEEIKNIISNRIRDIDKFRKSDHPIKFLFVGSIMEIKGVLFLIEEFSGYNKRFHLDIIGKGAKVDVVVQSTSNCDNINYLGFKTGEELKAEFISHDILIVPSLWDEPFGRVVVEGNNFGLPVIVSNKGGMPEIINKIGGGEIFNPDIEGDLLNKINKAINVNNLLDYYRKIGNNIMYYDIKNQVSMFLNVYNKLVD